MGHTSILSSPWTAVPQGFSRVQRERLVAATRARHFPWGNAEALGRIVEHKAGRPRTAGAETGEDSMSKQQQLELDTILRQAGSTSYACVDTWLTDFRADLSKIDIPCARPVRGDGGAAPALIVDCTLVPVEGGPHNIAWTHPDEVNAGTSHLSRLDGRSDPVIGRPGTSTGRICHGRDGPYRRGSSRWRVTMEPLVGEPAPTAAHAGRA